MPYPAWLRQASKKFPKPKMHFVAKSKALAARAKIVRFLRRAKTRRPETAYLRHLQSTRRKGIRKTGKLMIPFRRGPWPFNKYLN